MKWIQKADAAGPRSASRSPQPQALGWHDKMMGAALCAQLALIAGQSILGACIAIHWASTLCAGASLAYCALEWARPRAFRGGLLICVAPLMVCAYPALMGASGA